MAVRPFEAGSIITVDYVPTPAPIAASPDLFDAASGDTEVAPRGATSSQSSANVPSLAPGQGAQDGEEEPRNLGDDAARSAHPTGTAATAPSVPGVFLILAQDYTTELVEARYPPIPNWPLRYCLCPRLAIAGTRRDSPSCVRSSLSRSVPKHSSLPYPVGARRSYRRL